MQDNLDLQLKYKLLQMRHPIVPLLVGIQAGAAWNTQVIGRDKGNADNFQYYGQIMLNTLLWKKFGLGLVPSYLYNSHIYYPDQ